MVLQRKHYNNFLYLLSFLLIATGIIFTDLPIYKNTVTHSTMIFIAPIIFTLVLILNNYKLKISKNLKVILAYISITFLISFLFIFYFTIVKGEYYAYGESIFTKHFEAFISLGLLHFLVYFLLLIILNKLNLNTIKKVVYFIFIFLTLVAIIEYLSPEKLNLFHTFPKDYNRLRLLSMEPSQAFLVYLTFGLLSLLFVNNIFAKSFIFSFIVIVSIFIGSKGGFISIFLATVVLFFKNFHKIKYFALYLMLTLIAFYFLINFALPALFVDIVNFTSFSTRFSGLISSFIVLFTNPLGLGYGSYLIKYPTVLDNSYKIVNNLFLSLFNINFNYNEVLSIISTGENIGAKAGIPQSVVFNGWIGLIFWFAIFKNSMVYIRELNINILSKNIFVFMIFVIFIQLFIALDYTILYVIWLPIAFIESIHNKQKGCLNNEK